MPDCDLKNLQVNGECGAINNRNFGTNNGATRFADDVEGGLGSQPPYLGSARGVAARARAAGRIDGRLLPDVVGEFHHHGQFESPRRAITIRYCVTAPTDSRLPGGGGYQVCGLYDVSRPKFGQVDNLMVKSEGQRKVYNGFDVLLNARLGRGIFLIGGVNTGTELNYCASPDFPPQFCDRASATTEGLRAHGWAAGTDVKWNVVYPLPW